MATLIFFSTVLTIIVFTIRIIIKLFKHRSIKSYLRLLIIVTAAYSFLWIFFYYKSSEKIVLPGTDICFDDWCATITKAEQMNALGDEKPNCDTVFESAKTLENTRRVSSHAMDGYVCSCKGVAQ